MRAQFADPTTEGALVAREATTFVRSDLSGEIVPEGQAATITIEFADRRRNRVELDVADHEVADLVGKGREIKRRGRKPGTKNGPRNSEG